MHSLCGYDEKIRFNASLEQVKTVVIGEVFFTESVSQSSASCEEAS